MRTRVLNLFCGLLVLIALAPGGVGTAHSASFRPIALPADAGSHADAHNEWWYFTGHLRDTAGHTYGFELTNFKFIGLRQLSSLMPFDRLFRIDLAITDEHAKQFYSAIGYVLPSPDKGYVSPQPLNSRMIAPGASLAIHALPGPGLAYQIQGAMANGSLDLHMRTTRPALLEGKDGLEEIDHGYSYYYSLTNLETAGTLVVKGRQLQVTGTTWMDHQWGNWDWKYDKGWDWMAVQLNNGVSFSLVNFRSGRGKTFKFSAVSFPDGHQFFTTNASMSPLGKTWTSHQSATVYPIGWRIAVPALGLIATVEPTVVGQEMVDPIRTGTTYWEGSGTLVGTVHGRPVTGLTYTELAGYARRGGLPI